MFADDPGPDTTALGDAEPEEPPPQYPFRNLIAIFLAFIMFMSVAYGALRPFVLSYVDTSRFDIALTAVVDANTVSCGRDPIEEPPTSIQNTQVLCICGIVFAGGRRADEYQLILRDNGFTILDRAVVRRTTDGSFCHRWELNEMLGQGQYRLDVRRDHLLDTYWFRVQSVSSI